MTNVLKIPANSQAYLFATRDIAQDKFDVRRFAYGYSNIATTDAWAYWKMDEESGTRIDSTGHGHHLSAHAHDVSFDAGKVANAVKLTYSITGSGRLDLGSEGLNLDDDAPFTISMWFKYEGFGNDYSASFNTQLEIWFMAAGSIELFTPGDFDIVTGAVSEGAWHLVVFRYDGNLFEVHVDHALAASDTGSTGFYGGDITPLAISNSGTTSDVIHFDEVGIWTRALTNAELDALWNSGAGTTFF